MYNPTLFASTYVYCLNTPHSLLRARLVTCTVLHMCTILYIKWVNYGQFLICNFRLYILFGAFELMHTDYSRFKLGYRH